MSQEIEKLDSVSVEKSRSDVEADVVSVPAPHGLKRQMKDRHITMIRHGHCAAHPYRLLTLSRSIGGEYLY